MRIIIGTILCLLYLSTSNAQTLNGIWTGNYQKMIGNNPKLTIELFLINDSIITGSSHLLYNHGNYEHHKIDGHYNKKDSTYSFSESLIESTRLAYEVAYKMKLTETDSTFNLSGRWKSKSGFPVSLSVFNKVWLSKPKVRISDSIVMNKPARAENIQKFIEITNEERDSIKISVYDNGIVDGDSITVFFNDSVIINHQRISETPISLLLSLSKEKQFPKIKMVADNLGTIPPNTALMIIETKRKRYEVHLSSDLESSGVVEFILK